jgi:twitching motility protein PilT
MGTVLALSKNTPMDRTLVDDLLTRMLQSSDGVSDLIFITGRMPLVEAHGWLQEFPIETANGSLLTPTLLEELSAHITGNSERLQAEFDATGSCDCSYVIDDVARFRANVYKENGRHAIVMRKLESSVPTLARLKLPKIFREIVKTKNGIVLVTGAAGSGKTTTLAAMINELNQTEAVHIVTLEDPIEFQHPHARAAISHRELGKDFRCFAEGLRAALRQAPKAILVGEIRDRETIEVAMTAAETGHVVFSTLHTINAGQSINRILGFFRPDEESQVRERLADSLRYVVSQKLVNRTDSGRLLITEVMGSNLRTRETIRYGESENKTFHEIIQAAGPLGWHTFNQSLLEARQADLITNETAMAHCGNKTTMHQQLDLLSKRRGLHAGSTSSGLKLERHLPVIPAVPDPETTARPEAVSEKSAI